MKTKLLSLLTVIVATLSLHAQTNSITVTSVLPSTIEIGQTIKIDYEYTLAANATDQQIKVGFNKVTLTGGYLGNGDANYSGGLGIGATSGPVTGSLTITITKPASSTLTNGDKYTYDISIQENGGSYTTYASATQSGTTLTVNEASGVINAIAVTNTLPTTAAQGDSFDVEVDYSITQAGKIQLGIAAQGSDDMSSQWGNFSWLKDYYIDVTATTGTLHQIVTVTVPADAPLSSTFTGYKRYRVITNLLDNSYATLATASTLIDPFTVTAALNLENANADGVAIYPNPVSDRLMINTKRLQANQIRLSDIMGRTVKLIKNAKDVSSIDVSNLSNGIYILNTDNGKQLKFLKK